VTLGLTAVQELEPAGRVTLWLYCDDADAEVERLRAAGVEVVREPEDREWGERAGSVRTPTATRSGSRLSRALEGGADDFPAHLSS
jgi:predicted enzyme related to lactoylglutathione lyase